MKKMIFITLISTIFLLAEDSVANQNVIQYSTESAVDWQLTYEDPLWTLNYLAINAQMEQFNLRVGLEPYITEDTLFAERFFVEEAWGVFPIGKSDFYWGKMPLNFGGSYDLIHPSENPGISKPLWFSEFLSSRYNLRFDWKVIEEGPAFSVYLNNGNKGNVSPPTGTYGIGGRMSIEEIQLLGSEIKFGLSGFARQDSTEVTDAPSFKPYRLHSYGGVDMKISGHFFSFLSDLAVEKTEIVTELDVYWIVKTAVHDVPFLQKIGNPAFFAGYEMESTERSRLLFGFKKDFSENTWMKMECVLPFAENETAQIFAQMGFSFE